MFWVSAINPASLRNSFLKAAERLAIPGVQDPQRDVLSLFFNWSSDDTNGPWLMVLDNADDSSFVFGTQISDKEQRHEFAASKFLPQAAHGSILITSRYKALALSLVDDESDQVIEVDVLSEERAVELLRTKLPRQRVSDKDARKLVRECGCIPLAIAQATSYLVKRSRVSTSEYTDWLRNDDLCKELLSANNGSLRRDPAVSNAVLKT